MNNTTYLLVAILAAVAQPVGYNDDAEVKQRQEIQS
jgi:hypothetical protein